MEIRDVRPPSWPLLEPLIASSIGEGFGFLVRLKDEYVAGRKRFNGPDEILLGAYDGGQLVGVCGLTRDPYGSDPTAGRVRHLYVHPEWRGQGVGRALVAAIEAHGRAFFASLVLRTDSAASARFYTGLGYEACVDSATATHRRVF